MPAGLITSRPLQNESTGIDLRVPLYQEIRGAMMTGHVEYQIIVVTRLAAFKSPRHKPGDVVQLVVSKKYSEMDEFHTRLMAQYPGVALPAMPRKALFVGESDIRERRAAFDELVKFIAQDATLAGCQEVLEFLGAKSTEADVRCRNIALGEEPDEEELSFFQTGEADISPKIQGTHPGKPRREKQGEEEGEEEDEVYLGPLGKHDKTKKKTKPLSQPGPVEKVSLFEDDDLDTDLFRGSSKDDLKLFSDPDLGGTVRRGDSLLLPTAYGRAETSASLGPDEDTDELFRVEDDFDKLLQVTKAPKEKPQLQPKPHLRPKPELKPKPAVKPRPAGSASPSTNTGSSSGQPALAVSELKGQSDILKYIQQNEEDAADAEALF